jgi:hypothetical protein
MLGSLLRKIREPNANRTPAFAGPPRERHHDLKVLEDQITIGTETKSPRDPGEPGRKPRGSIDRIAGRVGRRGEIQMRGRGP